MKFRKQVKRAVEIVGSQAELARRIGVKQPSVWKMCNTAQSITPAIALKIEKATGGQVTRRDLLPELFAAA